MRKRSRFNVGHLKTLLPKFRSTGRLFGQVRISFKPEAVEVLSTCMLRQASELDLRQETMRKCDTCSAEHFYFVVFSGP